MVAIADAVDQQPGGCVNVGDDDVDVTVVVDVAKRGAAADFEQLEQRSRLRRDILESSIAQIAEEELRFAVGKPLLAALLDRFDRAVGNEQVQPAIVVEIEPGCTKPRVAESHRAKSRRGALIFEQPGTDIAI